MNSTATLIATLAIYQASLIGIGLWASRRTRDGRDFYLGGRRLGPWIGALASAASSSSAWTLLGVSGAAFQFGLGAIWLLPGCTGGFALNWFLVARRLRDQSAANGSMTLSEFLAHGAPPVAARRLVRSASWIILLCLSVYIAAQFQAAGKTFAGAFGLDPRLAVLAGGLIVLLYTTLGGYWAVSVTDVLQGLVMVGTALLLPLAALQAVGGLGELWAGLRAQDAVLLHPWQGKSGAAALGLVLGYLGIGLGYPGQPHVMIHYMALRDETALRRGRVIALSWALLIYSGMLLTGWCGRVLLGAGLADRETVLLGVTTALFPAVMSGVVLVAVLSAIMSTVDSQLLVCGATVAHDLPAGRRSGGLRRDRAVVFGISFLAVAAALLVRESIFKTVLFAWSGLGAAFGPLLLARLWRGPVRPGYALAAMWSGFAVTLLWFFTPALKNHLYELVPAFLAASVPAWLGSRRPRAVSPPG